MKRFIVFLSTLFIIFSASAQTLAVGDRAPELKVKQWLTDEPDDGKKVSLIEFFSSTNPVCVARLPILDSMAALYGNSLCVILVAKEDMDGIVNLKKVRYSVASDPDCRVFKSYGIQFVPCGVITDARGKVMWVGNTSSVNVKTVKKWIEDGSDKDRTL